MNESSPSPDRTEPDRVADPNAAPTAQTQGLDATVVPVNDGASTQPSSTQSSGTGQTLGQYELLELLGQGGMGTVYKARHKKLDKLVAIKLLPADFMRSPQSVARFEREMKAVGKIDHPNIVRAMDAGEINGTHYLTMELVEGTDLQKFVKRHGPLSIIDACQLIRQTARGLQAAHKAGMVHRDIKPSNLLLSNDDQIKILDLGLALVGDDQASHEAITSSGQVLGTSDYMAPEQWEDTHTADLRTDLYALGCTLFYLLTGRAPYATDDNKSAMKKMAAHGNAPIPDLKAARGMALSKQRLSTVKEHTEIRATSDISDELNAIYLRLMAKRPEDRYLSAGELAHALEPFATSNVGQSTSPQATEYKRDAVVSGLLATTVTHVSNGESLPAAPPGKKRFGRLAATTASLLVLGLMIILALKHGAEPTTEGPGHPQTAISDNKHDAQASGFLTPSSGLDGIDFAAERKPPRRCWSSKKGS